MTHDEIVRLVLWTMKFYGSDARELSKPGSKLRSQAEHIAAVMSEYAEAERRLAGMLYVKPSFSQNFPVDMREFPRPD